MVDSSLFEGFPRADEKVGIKNLLKFVILHVQTISVTSNLEALFRTLLRKISLKNHRGWKSRYAYGMNRHKVEIAS